MRSTKRDTEICGNPCDSRLDVKSKRKPDLQRYRPGQGLQHKKLISSKKSDRVNNDTSAGVKNSVKLDNVDDSTKSSKHPKNRRQDMQVYTLKTKAVIKLPGKASTNNNRDNRRNDGYVPTTADLREKRDEKSTHALRFQKPKALDTNFHKSGGIPKISIEHDPIRSPTKIMEKLYISNGFPEPPKMFMHNYSFDPYNPSKPDILSIPAPIPPPHMPYGNFNQMYCVADWLNCPNIPAPVDRELYIPPPQPLVTNPSFNYTAIHEIAAPVPCQFSQLNNILTSPSHAYEDMSSDGEEKRLCHDNFYIPPPKPLDVNGDSGYSSPASPTPDYVPTDSRKKIKQYIEEIVLMEKELSSALTKSLIKNDLNHLNIIRYKLQIRYEKIILSDPKYCAEENPEERLWENLYHQIIEAFGKKLEEDQKNSEMIKDILFKLITEGSVFYENMLEKQQQVYGFNLSKMLNVEHIDTSYSDHIRIVLVSVQKHLLYLGDLARLQEQMSQSSKYGKSRSWYLKAQKIAPSHGKPYSKLGHLAVKANHKLDAIYCYIRSLSANKPFLSTKDDLLSLFREIERKHDMYEKKHINEGSVEAEILENQTAERCQVWIKNNGSSSEPPAEVEKSTPCSELKKLSDVEISKRFITSFIHVHGKLFTKIGMETFPHVLNTMLTEFDYLLQRSPIPLTSVRLLQLLAINMFSVTNSSVKENGHERGGESLLEEQAIYTSMAMMSLMMDRCCLLQVAHKSSGDSSTQLLEDDFATLLPSIKIWTDWMSCEKYLWRPASLRILENVQSNNNIWTSFAAFLSVLQSIDTTKIEVLTEPCPNSELIILAEDEFFAGFVPDLGIIQVPSFAVQPFNKNTAKHCARIKKIQFFGDYLCGISLPYLKFDVTSKRFVAAVDNFSFKETSDKSLLLSIDELGKEQQ